MCGVLPAVGKGVPRRVWRKGKRGQADYSAPLDSSHSFAERPRGRIVDCKPCFRTAYVFVAFLMFMNTGKRCVCEPRLAADLDSTPGPRVGSRSN